MRIIKEHGSDSTESKSLSDSNHLHMDVQLIS